MKVVVTGGAGYIGSTLVPILVGRGYDVTVLDRLFFGRDSLSSLGDKVNVVRDDIRSCGSEIFEGADAVLDLASLSNDPSGELDPQKTLEINFKGRVRVAELARKQKVSRYVLASTCSVYGSSESIANETSALNPLTAYARANALAEQETLKIGGGGFCKTILRQATVYGLSKRMRFDLAVNGMVLAYHKHGKISIMRDGTQWRPFVHVADTSKAFVAVLEAEKEVVDGEVFNVGSEGQNIQVMNLAKVVAESMDVPFEYQWYGSPDKRNYRVSFEKIGKKLGFKADFTPRDGAREIQAALRTGALDPDDPRWITVEWYKKLLSNPELGDKVALNGVII